MTKTSLPKHPGRGLTNPTVTARKPAIPLSKNPAPQKSYQTHIPEPRWQRIISLIAVACFLALELYFWLRRK